MDYETKVTDFEIRRTALEIALRYNPDRDLVENTKEIYAFLSGGESA